MSTARQSRRRARDSPRGGVCIDEKSAAAPVPVCDNCGDAMHALPAICSVADDRHPDVKTNAVSDIHAEICDVGIEQLCAMVVGTATNVAQRVSAHEFRQASQNSRVEHLRKIQRHITVATTTLLAVEFVMMERLAECNAFVQNSHTVTCGRGQRRK